MSTTFKDMQDAVIDSLHPAIKSQSNYSLDLVKTEINKGYFNFVERTKCIEDTIDITTVANQVSYTKSDNSKIATIIQPYEIRYLNNNDNGYLLHPYPGGHSNLPRVLFYGLPIYYWIKGGNANNKFEIGTWPIIDADNETLRILAFVRPSIILSADSDEPLIDEPYREALINYALYKIYRRFQYLNADWHNESMIYKGEYLEKIAEWQENNYTDDMGELPSVVDVFGDW